MPKDKSLAPPALDPATVAPRIGAGYPAQFQAICEGREKRALGDEGHYPDVDLKAALRSAYAMTRKNGTPY